MSTAREHIVWLDMEMTGLDPVTCVPVQIAVIVTNAELEELDSAEVTIWQPDTKLLEMTPFVRKMHTDNGLYEKIRSSNNSVLDAERKMLETIARWCKPNEGVLASRMPAAVR